MPRGIVVGEIHRRLAHALAPIDPAHGSLQRAGAPAAFLESSRAHPCRFTLS